jgi:hypothetical protein
MNLNTELSYHRVIDRTTQNMEATLGRELAEKVNKMWKRKLALEARKGYLKKREHEKQALDPDLEEEAEDTGNVCYCRLMKINRKEQVWVLKMATCVVQTERFQEFVFPGMTGFIKSEFR